MSNFESEKTNPPHPSLTPRQLCAARLLTRGLGSAQVARALSVTQRSVNRWKMMLAFQDELRRLHELLVTCMHDAGGVSPSQSLSNAATAKERAVLQSIAPDPFDADAREDAEMEALIESLIGPDPALPLLKRQSNLRREAE
jgi:DNA-binding CsgD family transcriptional regulator